MRHSRPPARAPTNGRRHLIAACLLLASVLATAPSVAGHEDPSPLNTECERDVRDGDIVADCTYEFCWRHPLKPGCYWEGWGG